MGGKITHPVRRVESDLGLKRSIATNLVELRSLLLHLELGDLLDASLVATRFEFGR